MRFLLFRRRYWWDSYAPEDGARTGAVVPRNDLVSHGPYDEDCVCGPRLRILTYDDMPDGYIIVHHALDGRP